jgi:hypothetical protein
MDGRRLQVSHKLNPLKFMEITRKDPFTGDINTHNLNITGEEMTLWKKEIPIFKMLFLILLETKEFVKTGINIGTFDALFEDEDEDKMRMKIFLTTSTLE